MKRSVNRLTIQTGERAVEEMLGWKGWLTEFNRRPKEWGKKRRRLRDKRGSIPE